jgi:uncharacterized protein YlxP (DUF503 family)
MTRPIVGVCTLELEIPENDSLRAKSAILRSLMKRLQGTFNLAIAEIDRNDIPDNAIIAFTVVSNSSRHAEAMITSALNWIDEHGRDVLVVNETVEIL